MESIYSYFQSLENIRTKKENITKLIEQLNLEIKNSSIQFYKTNNKDLSQKIEELENKKRFLEEYPRYLKVGVKEFFKNIISMLEIFGIVFVLVFICFIWISHSEIVINKELVFFDLILSGGISLYGAFIEPVINNYRKKRDILDEFQNTENLDIEIKKIQSQQKENDIKLAYLEDEINNKKKRIELLTEYFNKLSDVEYNTNLKFQGLVDSIWDELAKKRYQYECDNLVNTNLLKLTK